MESNQNPFEHTAVINNYFEEGKLVDGDVGGGPVTVTDV